MKFSTEQWQAAVAAVENAYDASRLVDTRPDWLAPVQRRALAMFARNGFPTTRHEDWKYTNVTELARAGGEMLARSAQEPDFECIERLLARAPRSADAYSIIFANGRFAPRYSQMPGATSGIRIHTLATADQEARDRFTAWIDGAWPTDAPSFAALNAAFVHDGLFVEIAADVSVNKPIHVIFATDGQSAATQTRLLIDVGENSDADVIEQHVSGGPGWTNALTELRCARASHVTYVKLQDEDDTTDHIAAQQVVLDRESLFRAAHVDIGARLARNDLHVRMTGEGGHAELFGLFLVDGQRHVDNHTLIEHVARHTTSREHYRGIVGEHGRGVFNGKIIVHEGADGTDAQLNNRNLLLSKTAEIDTKPELEIYTDDVKCAHGATTGQLDPQALFYLRARGIPLDVARHVLILAFAREVVAQFDPADTALLDYINQALERRLPE